LTLKSSDHEEKIYLAKDHQPWRDPVYARSRLELWGKPTDTPLTWGDGKYQRLSRVPRLITGNSVLDVGCGCGHLYALLKDKIGTYTGLDFKAMVDICREFFPETDWREGNVYDLSKFGMYDTVVATQLFIHLPDIIQPLQQCWTHAKKALLFTLRTTITPGSASIRVNEETGTLAHRYTGEELSHAINLLGGVGNIEAYIGHFTGRIMYVKLTRKTRGKDIYAHRKMFNRRKLARI